MQANKEDAPGEVRLDAKRELEFENHNFGLGFPGGSAVKNLLANAGGTGSILGCDFYEGT